MTRQGVNQTPFIDPVIAGCDLTGKGLMQVAGLQKALLEPLPVVREAHVKRYVAMIVNWAGY